MTYYILLLRTKPFPKGDYFLRKEFAPVGANSFLKELSPFKKGGGDI